MPPGTTTRTLRIDADLDRAIAKRASFERVSVNALVSRSLRKFIDWDVPTLDFGMVIFPKILVDRLALLGTEETLEKYGREVARELIMPVATIVSREFTVTSAVEVLRRVSLYAGTFRFNFDYEVGRDSRTLVLLIRHDNGRLWSRFYFGMIDETFRVLLKEDVKTECTDLFCTARLALR